MSLILESADGRFTVLELPERLNYGRRARVAVGETVCSQCDITGYCLLFDTSNGEYGFAALCLPCVNRLMLEQQYMDTDGNYQIMAKFSPEFGYDIAGLESAPRCNVSDRAGCPWCNSKLWAQLAEQVGLESADVLDRFKAFSEAIGKSSIPVFPVNSRVRDRDRPREGFVMAHKVSELGIMALVAWEDKADPNAVVTMFVYENTLEPA